MENWLKEMKLLIKKSYWQQDIKKKEYLIACIKGSATIFIIAALFYHSLILGLCLQPFLAIYIIYWSRQQAEVKKRMFQLQFKDGMQAMAAALRTGYSVENAMIEVFKDINRVYGKDTRIIKEFSYMIRQLEINIPLEKVWGNLAERVEQEDVENFVAVFNIAKRRGGNSIDILRQTIDQISEKIEIKRDIDIIIAKKQLEFRIMSVIPLVMVGYMYIGFPEFMTVLYGNLLGIVIMTICLGVYIVAYAAGRKIIKIEV